MYTLEKVVNTLERSTSNEVPLGHLLCRKYLRGKPLSLQVGRLQLRGAVCMCVYMCGVHVWCVCVYVYCACQTRLGPSRLSSNALHILNSFIYLFI
jgi:hypothetical protein